MSSDLASNGLPGELRRESTAEQVASVLRELIIGGRLAPGTHVREEPIAAQLGVAKNTLREATNILVGQGLMRREVHRGAFVTELDADDVRDLYRVRLLVEASAAREAAVTGVDLRPLRDAVDALGETVASGDVRSVLDADLACHRVLVEVIGSDRLGGLFEGIEAETRLGMALADVNDIDAAAMLDDHVEILTALQGGRAVDAVTVLERHLEDGGRRLLARLDSS